MSDQERINQAINLLYIQGESATRRYLIAEIPAEEFIIKVAVIKKNLEKLKSRLAYLKITSR